MANNKVVFEIHADDNGSLKVVANEANKAAKETTNLSNSTNKLKNSRNKYQRTERGTAKMTSNSTKEFSKQAQSITSGLVPAYAKLAATVFAVSSAFNTLSQAESITKLEQGLNFVGKSAGKNLPYVSEQLQKITKNAISVQEAMRSVALGTSSGFSTKQLENLTKVADGAAKALGRNMEDALGRLVKGSAKLETEILDELGLFVRLEDVTREYADRIGKARSALTQFERRQAFTNKVIDQGLEKFGRIQEEVDPSVYDRLAASFKDLTQSSLSLVNSALTPILNLVISNKTALVGAMTAFGASISKQVMPSMYKTAEAAENMAKETEKVAKEQMQLLEIPNQRGTNYNKYIQKIKEGVATEKEEIKTLNGLTAAMRQTTGETKNLKTAYKEVYNIRQKGHIATRKQIEATALHAASVGRLKDAYYMVGNAIGQENDRLKEAIKYQSHYVSAVDTSFTKFKKRASNALTATKERVKSFGSAASIAAKTAGSAFIRFLPYIGLITTAVSGLVAIFNKLTEDTKIEKAVDEAITSFKEFDKINTQLARTLNDIQNEFDGTTEKINKLTAAYKAASGITTQITSQAQNVIQSDVDQQIKSMDKYRKRINELEDSINTIKTGGDKWYSRFFIPADKQGTLDILNKKLEKTKNSLKEARQESTSISEKGIEGLKKLIEGAIARLRGSEEFSSILSKQIKQYQKLLKSLDTLSPEKIINRLRGINRVVSNTSTAFSNAEKAAAKLTTALDKTFKVEEGPFKNVVTELKTIQNNLTSSEKSQSLLKKYLKEAPQLKKQLEAISGTSKITVSTFNKWVAKWEELNKNAKELETKNNQLKAKMEPYKDLMDKNVEAYKKVAKLSNQQISNELKIKTQLLEQTNNKKQEKILQTEINTLAEEKISPEEKQLKISKIRLQSSQKLFKLDQKINKNKLNLLEKEIEAEESKLKSAAREEDGKLSPQEELKIAKELKEKRLKAARREKDIRISSITREYDLLESKAKLLKQELQSKGLDTSSVTTYISKLEDAEDSAKKNVMQEWYNARSKINEGTAKTAEKVTKDLQQVQTGAKAGFQELKKDSLNFAKISEDAVTGAFNGMSNALTDFIMTGEMQWEDFAISAIRSITNVMIKMQAMQALTEKNSDKLGGWLGSALKMGFDVVSSAFGGDTTSNSQGNAFNNGQLIPYANGGITSGGLSASNFNNGSGSHLNTINSQGNAFNNGQLIPYANGGIVDNPTIFPMANGAGLMGEAGPEAVMPLTRTQDGNLGVQAQGNDAPNVTVQVINKTDEKASAKQGETKWDGEKWVMSIVLDAANRNKGGFGRNLNAALQKQG